MVTVVGWAGQTAGQRDGGRAAEWAASWGCGQVDLRAFGWEGARAVGWAVGRAAGRAAARDRRTASWWAPGSG